MRSVSPSTTSAMPRSSAAAADSGRSNRAALIRTRGIRASYGRGVPIRRTIWTVFKAFLESIGEGQIVGIGTDTERPHLFLRPSRHGRGDDERGEADCAMEDRIHRGCHPCRYVAAGRGSYATDGRMPSHSSESDEDPTAESMHVTIESSQDDTFVATQLEVSRDCVVRPIEVR
jgi:hypothetical protein